MMHVQEKFHQSNRGATYGPLDAIFEPAPETVEDIAGVNDGVFYPTAPKGTTLGFQCFNSGSIEFAYTGGSSFIDLGRSYVAVESPSRSVP